MTSVMGLSCSAARLADGALPDELDPGLLERRDELHERIHIAADDPVACFHALDRRDGEPGQLRELALIDSEQSPGRA